MCKLDKKNGNKRIDPCIRNLVKLLDSRGVKLVACCCGHGKYPMSIIAMNCGIGFEIMTQTTIPRKKRFYKRDKQGYYYIPEVCSHIIPKEEK